MGGERVDSMTSGGWLLGPAGWAQEQAWGSGLVNERLHGLQSPGCSVPSFRKPSWSSQEEDADITARPGGSQSGSAGLSCPPGGEHHGGRAGVWASSSPLQTPNPREGLRGSSVEYRGSYRMLSCRR